MLKFKDIKPLATILQQCEEQGVPVNKYLFDSGASDSIVVGHTYGTPLKPGHVFYNTVNGCFYGKTDKGVDFNSQSDEHDNEPWMQALLTFFYTEAESEEVDPIMGG